MLLKDFQKVLTYNPDTGIFTWKISRTGRNNAGDVAGLVMAETKKNKEYLAINVFSTHYLAHRVAWLFVHGCFPTNQIDHIDGDGLNNAISNLRDVTPSENARNVRMSVSNKSGMTGVWYNAKKNRYIAQVNINKKNINLGCFVSFKEAAEARKAANIKYGFHQNHGVEK